MDNITQTPIPVKVLSDITFVFSAAQATVAQSTITHSGIAHSPVVQSKIAQSPTSQPKAFQSASRIRIFKFII